LIFIVNQYSEIDQISFFLHYNFRELTNIVNPQETPRERERAKPLRHASF